jgi:hypothetical protein
MQEDLLKIIVAAVGGLAGGFITATITARSKIRELNEKFRLEQRIKEDEDRAKNQSNYFGPLRVTTGDLHKRMVNIEKRIGEGDSLLQDTVTEVDSKIRGSGASARRGWPRRRGGEAQSAEFEEWANGFGEYALSTL